MTGTPHGFRIIGPCHERRRLVDAASALHGYATCLPGAQVENESYLSAFQFPDEFALQRRDGHNFLEVADYDGVVGADHLHIDIDRPDLDLALTEARRVASHLLHRYASLDETDLLVCYSGGKGFHIDVPTSIFDAVPSATFHRVARAVAVALAERAGIGAHGKLGHRIDEGIFDRVRPWRAVNSRHPKGLHKRQLTVEMLLHLSLPRIQELARAPESFDLPDAPGVDDQAAADWAAAVLWVHKQEAAATERKAKDGPARLNRLTREIICDVGEVGERHRHLFSAAANIGEFSSVEELAYALLTEPGRNCGLPPKQVAKQIRDGLAHAAKHRGGKPDAT